MKYYVASICVAIALLLDAASYFRQIRKIYKTKQSSQVSSTSFLYKIAKVCFSIVGLLVYLNFVGVIMEVFMLGVYVYSLYVIIRFKPKNWSIFQ